MMGYIPNSCGQFGKFLIESLVSNVRSHNITAAIKPELQVELIGSSWLRCPWMVGKISGAVLVALWRNEEDNRLELVWGIQTESVLLLLYYDR